MVDLEQALEGVLADVIDRRRLERCVRHVRRNDRPVDSLTVLAKKPCRCSGGSTSWLLVLLMFPSTLALMTPRGRTRSAATERRCRSKTCRVGCDGRREDRVDHVAGDPHLHGSAVLRDRFHLLVNGFDLRGWRPSAAVRRRRHRCRSVEDAGRGKLANVKRLWASPTLMLVFSTSPPINRFSIERLTVTVELRASRLALSEDRC